jgi:DNA-binding CsgD family transcriptional regulator
MQTLPLRFSKRELEVLQLVAGGKTSREIAGQLFVSLQTVESHRKNMIRKAGVRNMSAVIVLAIQNGIISTHNHDVAA